MRVLLSTVQPSVKDQHHYLADIVKLVRDLISIPMVQLDVADFLGNMTSVGVTASAQQQMILRGISHVFCEMLSSKSFLVQQYALRAFEMFFKRTPHSNLTSQSVKEGQEVIVSNFIQRKRITAVVDDPVGFWSYQTDVLTKGELLRWNLIPKLVVDAEMLAVLSEPIINGHGSMKRPRLEKGDEHLQFLLGNLEKVAQELGQFVPFPHWARTELQERIHTLNSYM